MVAGTLSLHDFNLKLLEGTDINRLSLEIGDIVKANVVEIYGDKAKLQFNDSEIPSQDIKIGDQKLKLGDNINFIIKGLNKNKIELKQIVDTTKDKLSDRNMQRVDMLKSTLSRLNVDVTKENIELADAVEKNQLELTAQTLTEANKLKGQISKVVNNATKDKLNDIMKNEISIDKLTMDILADMLTNKNNSNNEELDKKIKYNLDTRLGLAENSARENERLITDILKANDLPLTKNNVKYLKNTIKQANETKALSDADIISLVKKGDDLTLENMYRVKYSNSKYSIKDTNSIDIPNIDMEIQKTLKVQNIEETSENVEIAKTLVANQIDVVSENINTYKQIKDSVSKLDIGQIVNKAITNIQNDKQRIYINDNLEAIDSQKVEGQITYIHENIANIDEEIIKQVIDKKQIVNIKNLILEVKSREKSQENSRIIVENSAISQENQEGDLKVIRTKRQIEEIRFKLTVESAIRLKDKGINIDTEPVKQVVDGLRELEQKVEIEINNQKLAVDSDKVDSMKDLYGRLEVLKTRDLNIYTKVIDKKLRLNIENLSNECKKIDIESKLSAYEASETKPESRLGDNFRKVETQVSSVLEANNIQPTEINVKCAKILIKNNIEVNNDNIEMIKLYENKVQDVIDRLHPSIALEMMKDGLNPIEIHLDEVIEYIDEFKDKYGVISKEALYDSIATMEETKSITAIEKDALIAIYRAINTVEKTENVAIGVTIKNDMDFTLNNLLEGTKYMKTTRNKDESINVSIDDSFGSLSGLENIESKISSKVKNAIESLGIGNTEKNQEMLGVLHDLDIDLTNQNILKMINAKTNFKELKKSLDVESLKKIGLDKSILNEKIEILNEKLQELGNIVDKNKHNGNINDFLNNIEDIENVAESLLYALEKFDIPATLKNIEIMKNYKNDGAYQTKEMDKLNKLLSKIELEAKDTHKSQIRENITNIKEKLFDGKITQEILENMEQLKEEYIEKSELSKDGVLDKLEDVEQILKMNNAICEKEEYYQIPIYLGDRLTNLNLYFNNNRDGKKSDTKVDSNILVSLDTENMGNVSMDINIKGNIANVTVNTENKQDKQFIKENLESLKNLVESLGYTTEKVSWQNQKISNPVFQNIDKEIKRYKESKYEEIV